MASNMFLYWGSGSIPCWRAMIVLEEKGLQGYGNKLLSFGEKQHKSDEVTKLNPRGQLPTLKDGDVVVCESQAICEYLEYKFANQGTKLLPDNPADRAVILQRLYESQNLIKALMENLAFYFFTTKKENQDKDHIAAKKKDAKEELDRWEKMISKQGADGFIAGKSFSMADCFVIPILAFGVRSKLNLAQFPSLNAYYTRMAERPSVKASWPPHWKDSPATMDFFEGI